MLKLVGKCRGKPSRLKLRFLKSKSHLPFEGNSSSTMVKRKITACNDQSGVESKVHSFSEDETETFRKHLLQWYDSNKRELPWRTIAKKEEDVNKRAYAVWVSEIMLQQTQVATVIDYYNKWMKKWPTVQDLAGATLEEVNEMWSGLGYYSRGRRLHEGAQKIVNSLGGEMPKTAEALLRDLPGVGKYTAGAVASIALGQCSGLVDGNVSRVFSRMCVIGADITGQTATDAFWRLAGDCVDPNRPGDYNQGLMELGATVCTPKTPQCSGCPVNNLCKAYSQVQLEKQRQQARLGTNTNGKDFGAVPDIECAVDACKLCLPSEEPWESSLGVLNYPRKGKKKAPREERTAVCVLRRVRENTTDTEYLTVQRPQTGLLANLWEFPSTEILPDSSSQHQHINAFLHDNFAVKLNKKERQFVSEVVHIFSHIHQTYVVETANLTINDNFNADSCERPYKWVTKEEFAGSAVSTAMKKVFKAVESHMGKASKGNKSGKQANKPASDGKKQLGLDAFFKKKTDIS